MPAAPLPHAHQVVVGHEGVGTKLLLVSYDAAATVALNVMLDVRPDRFLTQSVRSVAEALDALASGNFECLVVDMGRAGELGLVALTALRRAASGAVIVMLSETRDDELGLRAIAAGADEYLVKDQIRAGQLARAIAHAVDRARSTAVLRDLSDRSSQVLAALSDGIAVVDLDGRIVSVNPAASAMVDEPAHALVGQLLTDGSWSTVNADGDPFSDNTGPSVAVIAGKGRGRGVVTGIRRADGSTVWVEISTDRLHTSDGHVNGVVISMREISERLEAERHTRFQAALLAAVGQAVVGTDPQGRIVFWNDAAEELYGWTATAALGRMSHEMVPAESEAQRAEINAAVRRGETWSGDFLVRRADGAQIIVLLSNTPVYNERGEPAALIGVSTDVTARRHAEDDAQAAAAIVASTSDAIYTVTIDATVLTWNPGAEQLYGYPARSIVGDGAQILRSIQVGAEPSAMLTVVAASQTLRGVQAVHRRADGTLVDVSLTVSPIYGPDGTFLAAAVIARDITDRRRLEQQLVHQALHDALTGLPNRTLLTDRLAQTLSGATRKNRPVAVLFCDLDQFKSVNDASGHLAGDKMLIEVARRLRAVVRPTDTVARYSGDEFVVVCDDADATEAQHIADRIAVALSEPIMYDGNRLYASASIGIAVTPTVGATAETLLRSADAAMYDAKARGRARSRVFDITLTRPGSDSQELTNELREALAQQSLEVHYQPVVALETGALVGAEALLRWNHPDRGWVCPDVFVPLAEEAGLIWSLDQWVLAQACRDAATLRGAGLLRGDARVAVNISARNVADPDLVDVVRQAADAAGLPFHALDLEVTETGLMTDATGAQRVLQAIRELGVGISLDDFGTGYSPLTNVRLLPVTTVKIDRGFVQHITSRPGDFAIAAAVIDLAQAVGLRTIAEGIETVEQLSLLRKMGCGAGQGYLWSKALPPAELAALVTDRPLGFLTTTAEPAQHLTS